LQFRSEDWSEDMEKELCLLRGRVVDADVAEVLMQNCFLEYSSQIIRHTTITRLKVRCDCSEQYDNADYALCLLWLAF
jgi:hypothetical protein